MQNLPRLTRLLVVAAAAQVAVFTLLRLVFWFVFDDPGDPIPATTLLQAFYLGLKFDLRLALLILLPLMIVGWFRWTGPLYYRPLAVFWQGYLTLTVATVLLFYVFDFGYYAYLKVPLDASILRFVKNMAISAEMVWQSYPVVWILLGLLAALGLTWLGVRRLVNWQAAASEPAISRKRRVALVTLTVCGVLFGLYGKLSWYPLRWSDAFFSSHAFAAAVTVNPVLYFYDTFENGGLAYDEEAVRRHYPAVASYLGVDRPDAQKLNFVRHRQPAGRMATPPNVVMVYLETFAWFKTGVSGNPLNPTPHMDALANNGILFDRFYVPHTGTARSVFAGITGIPDVQAGDTTSTRNPTIVDQHTVINAFKGHEKFYFLGGSANWGNIRGLLSHNLSGLRLYEEGDYSAPRIDVWGISDLNLFEEANRVLKEQEKPFFAIIQTAGNHRPYTIPEDKRGFEFIENPPEDVKKHGFISVEEYNSFRFMDHSVGFFMEQARKEPYFDNSIFVFFGDHGIGHDPGRHSPKALKQLGLNDYQVPLVIYAPRLLEPQRVSKVASEVDVLPTLAGIAGVPYTNTSFGRDLLDPRDDGQRYAFTVRLQGLPEVGLITDEFVYRVNENGTNERLFRLDSDDPRTDLAGQHSDQLPWMRDLALGLYETARYMINNNPRRPH